LLKQQRRPAADILMIGKLLNWTFVKAARLKNLSFTFVARKMFREFGSESRVCPPFRFAGLDQISVGCKVVINRDCWIGVVTKGDKSSPAKLVISDHAAIGMGSTISAAMSVILEDDVLLARNVYISDHGHAFEDVSKAIKDQGISPPMPVRIGRSTWLGQNVVVLPGVTIGEHCVIGANAVVRTSIPSYSVAVGIPARVVKTFNPQTGSWESAKPISGGPDQKVSR
jgi:acetyltransferase-like isoleucine patch superfamily enzyme